MPSRWLSLAIVVFWLATMGWLFWRDLWPSWRPGEPPPFHIDLVEEVQKDNKQKGGKLPTYWSVQRQRNKNEDLQYVFGAETWVEYHHDDDTFTLHAKFTAPSRRGNRRVLGAGASREWPKASSPVSVAGITIKWMESAYQVNRRGQLQSLRVGIGSELSKPLFGEGFDPELSLWGEVRDEQFFSHYCLCLPHSANPLKGDLPPAPVSYHGSILMPLHPVNRIHGLRPGQSWRQPLVDPLRDAFPTLPGLAAGVHYLHARVLPQPHVLKLSDDTEATCLVIEYTGEDMRAKTWVEQDSERVQQQEFTLGEEQWIIQRDPTRNKPAHRQRGSIPAAPAPRKQP